MRFDEPFSRQSVRLSLRILSCDERKIILLTAFVVTFCRHSIDSCDHRLGSPPPGSSLLSVRLAYSACVHYLWTQRRRSWRNFHVLIILKTSKWRSWVLDRPHITAGCPQGMGGLR